MCLEGYGCVCPAEPPLVLESERVCVRDLEVCLAGRSLRKRGGNPP